MDLICPKCHARIGAENVNVATDLAKCVACNEVFKAGELVADVDLAANLQPPAGSGIVLEANRDSTGSISVPKRGLSGSDAFGMLFATFWLCFIAFWTYMASMGSIIFAMFSIPFWLVGIGMWWGIIVGMTETQRIAIEPDRLVLAKKSALSSKTRAVPYDQIESIDVETVMPRDPFTMTRHMRHFTRISGMMGGIPMPTISHGTKKTRFAESVSEAEMKWLVKILKSLVYKKAGRRV